MTTKCPRVHVMSSTRCPCPSAGGVLPPDTDTARHHDPHAGASQLVDTEMMRATRVDIGVDIPASPSVARG